MNEVPPVAKSVERIREAQLLSAIPDVLNYGSLLYIGASENRMEMIGLFINKGYEIVILEVWEKNALFLVKNGFNVITGDVRQIERHIKGKFDIVLWWHGPEHVGLFEAGHMLVKLEKYAKKMVIAASPWGRWKQSAVNGNPYEEHKSEIHVRHYKSIGWETDGIGTVNIRGSNLIGWKRT